MKPRRIALVLVLVGLAVAGVIVTAGAVLTYILPGEQCGTQVGDWESQSPKVPPARQESDPVRNRPIDTPVPAIDQTEAGVVPDQENAAVANSQTDTGSWVDVPANIVALERKGGTTTLVIDILTHNPHFLPQVTTDDGIDRNFFINKNTALRTVTVNDGTKVYRCDAGPDGNYTSADAPVSLREELDAISREIQERSGKYFSVVRYFDIEKGIVLNIRGQCLP